uniref:Uncharacterized protein n=1 Tax=Arundo donax TaxID=35708 RepID=A0A0A9BG13_ARUDO
MSKFVDCKINHTYSRQYWQYCSWIYLMCSAAQTLSTQSTPTIKLFVCTPSFHCNSN